jgi:uncharacterized protein (TIGR02246 family)
MRCHGLLPIVVTFLLASCVAAGPGRPELSPADRQAIATLRAALASAIEQGDAAAYASLCEDDVQLLHSDAPLISGRAALEAHNAAIFAVVDVTRLVLTPVVVYGQGDLAYEVGTQELTIEPAVPGFRSSRKYVHVLRRGSDGTWRFAALISNNSE